MTEPALAALLDLLPGPALALDADGRPAHVNAALRETLGEALPALLRHPALRLLGRGDAAAETPIEIEAPVRRSWRARARRGLLSGRAITLVALDDRTERDGVRRLHADFVANASHELRTPLASLAGFVETLQGPAGDDLATRARFLDIMAGQAARMRRLIDGLLRLARVEMLEHDRPEGPAALEPILRRAVEERATEIAERAIVVSIEAPDDLPAIRGDADQLLQVIHNLLGNAIRFVPRRSGRVVLRISPEPAAGRADAAPPPDRDRWPARPGVVLRVRDNGPGFEPRHIPRLTERFYRIDGQPRDGEVGNGLGLAIVRHILVRHGARLRIEGAPGAGACFSVWFPVGDHDGSQADRDAKRRNPTA